MNERLRQFLESEAASRVSWRLHFLTPAEHKHELERRLTEVVRRLLDPGSNERLSVALANVVTGIVSWYGASGAYSGSLLEAYDNACDGLSGCQGIITRDLEDIEVVATIGDADYALYVGRHLDFWQYVAMLELEIKEESIAYGAGKSRSEFAHQIVRPVHQIRDALAADNQIAPRDKAKIESYLAAIEALAASPDPDGRILNAIGHHLKANAKDIAYKVGQRIAVDKILEFAEQLISTVL